MRRRVLANRKQNGYISETEEKQYNERKGEGGKKDTARKGPMASQALRRGNDIAVNKEIIANKNA